MEIAFFGDIVGEAGIRGVADYIVNNPYDFIVVNGENAHDTHGMTVNDYSRIMGCGVDCVTSGNHFFETDDIWKYDIQCPNAIRPANLIGQVPGTGTKQFIRNNIRIRVTNLIGKAFIRQESRNMFESFEVILADDDSDIHIITDVGMNDPHDSVIGYDTNACIDKNYNIPGMRHGSKCCDMESLAAGKRQNGALNAYSDRRSGWCRKDRNSKDCCTKTGI